MWDKNIRTLLPNINALSRHFRLSYLPSVPVHVFRDTQIFYCVAENADSKASGHYWSIKDIREK